MDGWDWNGNQTFFSDWKYQNTILQGKTLQFMPHICHHGRCLCKKIEHEKMHMDFNLFWQIFGFQICQRDFGFQFPVWKYLEIFWQIFGFQICLRDFGFAEVNQKILNEIASQPCGLAKASDQVWPDKTHIVAWLRLPNQDYSSFLCFTPKQYNTIVLGLFYYAL